MAVAGRLNVFLGADTAAFTSKLDRAEEVAPAGPDKLRVAVPKDLARAILAEVEPLPEHLAGAIWLGFLRGMIARAGGAPMHMHEPGRA